MVSEDDFSALRIIQNEASEILLICFLKMPRVVHYCIFKAKKQFTPSRCCVGVSSCSKYSVKVFNDFLPITTLRNDRK